MTKKTTSTPLIGWPLLPLPDDDGEMHFGDLEHSVRETIEVILRTRPGEQLMRPNFGAGLANFLHEGNTISTRRRIQDTVKQALDKWESRILIDRIEVNEVLGRPSQLRLEVLYRLRRTGIAQQVRAAIDLEAQG